VVLSAVAADADHLAGDEGRQDRTSPGSNTIRSGS
jgi:hypothetical protein